jgi:peptidoglycan/LPS O-acetylase OafA/YrhL
MSLLNLSVKNKIFASDKIASLDYWRALAILFVVFWHYFAWKLNLGLLGVQIFFVLSGFLVSRPLIQALQSKSKLPFGRFWISRLLRIIPSYYVFLALGSLILIWFFSSETLGIPDGYRLSYWLFFKNYNISNPRAFAHVWSLCVEEHFYLLLPFLFLLGSRMKRLRHFFLLLGALALSQIIIRYLGYTLIFEKHRIFFFSDPASTHNNFDGLLYGVLLRILYESGYRLKFLSRKLFLFFAGLGLLAGSLYMGTNPKNLFFYMVFFRTLNCLGIVFMIAATLEFKSDLLAFLRVIAFYSYNWYLWHMIAWITVRQFIGTGFIHFAVYFFFSFFLAVATTHLVEMNAYKLRRWMPAFS